MRIVKSLSAIYVSLSARQRGQGGRLPLCPRSDGIDVLDCQIKRQITNIAQPFAFYQ